MNILIIDINKDLAEVLHYLEQANLFTIDFCNNIEHCNSLMLQKKYDIVIIDFTIEKARQIIDSINSINPKQKIITISSELIHCNPEGIEYCQEHYNKLRLMKPVDLRELVYYINNFDKLSCKYAGKFGSPKGIVSILNDILRRFSGVSYDEKLKTIIMDNIHHLVDIVQILETNEVQYTVHDSKIVINH